MDHHNHNNTQIAFIQSKNVEANLVKKKSKKRISLKSIVMDAILFPKILRTTIKKFFDEFTGTSKELRNMFVIYPGAWILNIKSNKLPYIFF